MINSKLLSIRQLVDLASPMPPFILPLREKIRKGLKWQTRRVLDPQPASGVRVSVFAESGFEDGHGQELRPRYPAGVRYLREPMYRDEDGLAHYRDDGSVVIDCCGELVKWRWQKDILPQIFMPKTVARLFVNWHVVGIQELWAISIEDIKAEGISHTTGYGPILHDEFCQLWDSINAERGFGFNTNPYVNVYEFRKFEVQP